MVKNKIVNSPIAAKRAPSLLKNLMAGADLGGSTLRKEGFGLPIYKVVGTTASGEQRALDMSHAPIPSRSFAADSVALIYDGLEVKFVFAQKSLFSGTLESAVVIKFNPIAANNLAASFREIINPSLEEILDVIGASPEPLLELKSEPAQVVTLIANICASAIAGHETCLDFYHASAFAIRKAENHPEMEVEPVVRIDLRTSLFHSMRARLLEIDREIEIPN